MEEAMEYQENREATLPCIDFQITRVYKISAHSVDGISLNVL